MVLRILAWLGLPAWVAILVAAGGIVSGSYLKGRSDANANCRAAELQAKIEALQRDLAVQRDADAFEAAALRELEVDNAQKDMQIDLYVNELATRPDGDRCRLGPVDIERLRGLGAD